MSQEIAVAKRPGPTEEAMPEDVQDTRAGRFEGLLRDARYGARALYKKPGFTLVAVATLALGIGANSAIFSVVNAVLLTPIPVPSPDRVVMVWTDKVTHGSAGFPASQSDFTQWQSSGVFEKLAGFSTDGYNVLVGKTPMRAPGASVTKEWFEIEQVKPYLGRVFQQQDMQPGHDHVTVLNYDFWSSRFNADPSIVGRTIIVNSLPYTVAGVLPKKVAKVADEELYVPLLFDLSMRDIRYIGTVGRLALGVSLSAAQSRMNALSMRLEKQFPKEDGGNRARLQLIEQAYVEDIHSLVLILFGAVGFVLLVACANIANLLLVRGASRQKEIAIRAAMGASRFCLMRQLLTESVLLSILGGIAGIVPAFLGIRFLAKFKPETLPNAGLIALNPTILLFTLLLAIGTGLLFGIIPAWDGWRSNATSPLRERSQTGGNLRFGNFFVVGEVALTVILAVAAGLMLRSFVHLRSAYPGYNSQVLTMRVSLTGKQYDAPEQQVQFCKQLVQKLNDLPGVTGAAAIDALPTSSDLQGGTLHFVDRPEPEHNSQALVIIGSVTPDFFRAMHIPLVRGRTFTPADGAHDPLTVILDAGTAKQYWPNQDPIGRLVRVRINTPLRKIVGVVGAIDRSVAVKLKARIGQVYVPFDQWPSSDISLVVSSDISPAGLIPAVHRTISALAPDQPVYQIQTMQQARLAGQASSQFGTWLLGFFALLSLALAAIGVYGVVAYTVEQRTREFGLRMALGATQSNLLLAVLKKGFTLVLLGLALGFAGALLLNTLMGDLLHGISAYDPVAFLGTLVLLLFMGLMATFIPAFRASRVAPMIALRHE